MKGGKGNNIFGGIFINYGELHDSYHHSEGHKFRRTVDLFLQETYGGGVTISHIYFRERQGAK